MNKRAGAPPTIIDVARQAGVSIKTVSRVVNKEPTVHADTRARVQAAVAALNYRPQLSARSLAGAKSFLIGLLYYDPSAAFVAGVQQGATLRLPRGGPPPGRRVAAENGDDVQPQIEAMLAALRPDGMILTPPLCDNPRHPRDAARQPHALRADLAGGATATAWRACAWTTRWPPRSSPTC